MTDDELKKRKLFRAIPAVDSCLHALYEMDVDLHDAPRSLVRELVTNFWDEVRKKINAGQFAADQQLTLENQSLALLEHVRAGLRPLLRRVLNATGIVVHTNLGRSVLAQEAAEAAFMAASGYCNLEMNLHTGERGSRHDLIENLLQRLTGAEAALAVNNNAAAVLLVLDALCAPGEVIVSRGELIEIGGSFRIPDIMAKSGVILKEVGTTNRTHLHDYREAINENTAAIFCAHASNFRISGFHTAPALAELAGLAHEHHLPLIYDLGSGSLIDFSTTGLPPEPTVQKIVTSGVDIVCFSGDKALGGPQAGIIAGKKIFVDKCKKNPLARALRCDKLCLAALEATLRLYHDPAIATARVPTLHMITRSPSELEKEAKTLAAKLRRTFKDKNIGCQVNLCRDVSRVGGGAFPECDLPTTLVCLRPESCTAQELRNLLLNAPPPLVGRLENEAFCLDPRTLTKSQYADVTRVLVESLTLPPGKA